MATTWLYEASLVLVLVVELLVRSVGSEMAADGSSGARHAVHADVSNDRSVVTGFRGSAIVEGWDDASAILSATKTEAGSRKKDAARRKPAGRRTSAHISHLDSLLWSSAGRARGGTLDRETDSSGSPSGELSPVEGATALPTSIAHSSSQRQPQGDRTTGRKLLISEAGTVSVSSARWHWPNDSLSVTPSSVHEDNGRSHVTTTSSLRVEVYDLTDRGRLARSVALYGGFGIKVIKLASAKLQATEGRNGDSHSVRAATDNKVSVTKSRWIRQSQRDARDQIERDVNRSKDRPTDIDRIGSSSGYHWRIPSSADKVHAAGRKSMGVWPSLDVGGEMWRTDHVQRSRRDAELDDVATQSRAAQNTSQTDRNRPEAEANAFGGGSTRQSGTDDDVSPGPIPEAEAGDVPEGSLSYRAPAKAKFGYVDRELSLAQDGAELDESIIHSNQALSEPVDQPVDNQTMTPEPETQTDRMMLEDDGTPKTILVFEQINPESEPEGKWNNPEPTGNETTTAGCGDECRAGGGGGSESFAEPHPDWDSVRSVYGASFDFHVYLFGTAFALLAVYTAVCMVLLRRKRNFLSKGYFLSLNLLLLIIGVTRSIYLLVDAYDSHRRFPRVVSYLLINITFPCLTSAFSLLFMALLRATKMQLMARRIEKMRVLAVVIGLHFALSVLADVIVSLAYTARAMFLVCQVAFILWGMFLFCGYLYLFWKLYRGSAASERYDSDFLKHSSRGVAPTESHSGSVCPSPGKVKAARILRPRPVLKLVLRVTLATAILGITNVAIVIYGMVGVFSFLSHDSPQPWPYYSYHFCMRLVELAMCATMSFVATQPLRYRLGSSTMERRPVVEWLASALYLCPCYRMAVEGEDDGDSDVTRDKYAESAGQVDMPPGAERCWLGPAPDSYQMTPMMTEQEAGSRRTTTTRKPFSMLYYDNGFVRFRQDGDSEGDPIASTDEEIDSDNGPARNGYAGSRQQQYPGMIGDEQPKSVVQREPSMPVTGDWKTLADWQTPATPRSLCSTDMDLNSGTFSFRPPSSIHLRDSIERELNIPDFHLRTPDDLLETVDSIRGSISLPRSPDALRASVYSYATAGQTSRAMSTSPGRKLYSAQSFSGSTPSLGYHDLDTDGSEWIQRYLWERFGDRTPCTSDSASAENSLDAAEPAIAGGRKWSPDSRLPTGAAGTIPSGSLSDERS